MYEENRRQIASTPYCMAMRSKSVLCAVVEESSQAPRTAPAEVLDRAKRLATPPGECFASQTALCGLLLLPDASAEAYLKKNRSLFSIPETAAEPPCAPTDGTADTAIAPEERTDT